MIYRVAFLLLVCLFEISALGCSGIKVQEYQPQYTSTIEATYTLKTTPRPTQTLCPTNTPAPLLTAEPLNEQELANEIKLLGIKNLDEMIDLNTVGLIYYTYLDENDNEVPCISLIYNTTDIEMGRKAWNFYDNFSSKQSSTVQFCAIASFASARWISSRACFRKKRYARNSSTGSIP